MPKSKKPFKLLLLLDHSTDLLENLHKGTTKECKQFGGIKFLNFWLLRLFVACESSKNSKNRHFDGFLCYK